MTPRFNGVDDAHAACIRFFPGPTLLPTLLLLRWSIANLRCPKPTFERTALIGCGTKREIQTCRWLCGALSIGLRGKWSDHLNAQETLRTGRRELDGPCGLCAGIRRN